MINFSFSLSYTEIYILFISIFSFLYYSFDKLQAIRNNKNISRISEVNLLFSSFIGGTIGSILAMIIFRHKIRKLSFILKFIFIVSMQVLMLVVLGKI